MRGKTLLAAAVIVLAAGVAHAQGVRMDDAKGNSPAAKETQHSATGVVKKTDPARNAVTLAHGPVKSLDWPAMTMTFKVRDKALFNGLTVDRKIEFNFVQEGKDYVITAVK